MIWRVLTHIRMRWHEAAAMTSAGAADIALRKFADAADQFSAKSEARVAERMIASAKRHIEAADRLAEKLRGG